MYDLAKCDTLIERGLRRSSRIFFDILDFGFWIADFVQRSLERSSSDLRTFTQSPNSNYIY
jgi:hypothetical protein